MIYKELKDALVEAKREGAKQAVSDIIGAIDAVDKKVFDQRKKAGEDFIIKDEDVVAVLKNQIKNTKASLEKVQEVGTAENIQYLRNTVSILSSFLPPAVEGDELRLLVQGLGAKSVGQAMGLLKKESMLKGFDYDGKEASNIAKEIFV